MTPRHRSVVDVFVLLLRDDGRVLLLRRAGEVYASGLLVPPSGHLEAGEDVRSAAARELFEETGVEVAPGALEFAHLVHHRSPEGQGRVGVVYMTQRWRGTPVNREPEKCSALLWAKPGDPPADCVPYAAHILRRFDRGDLDSLHGWSAGAAPF
ncbi:NUDIX hydrolase [Streptomyces sp. URMC 123]|uniref:NUDIX hydrolase n=1 Tax=Streptomyces sp. URMC 123 TaxID=3423403 RepID=UPI003F19F8F5